jgi:hypothetical protein
MIIVIVALISILNLIKSGKIYLLASAWDFMNLLYIIGYLNVHWPINMRLFLDMFSITWLRLFAIPVNKIVFSPKKVHSNSIDMHLFRNITSNLVLLGATLAILIMCLVTKKIRSLKT